MAIMQKGSCCDHGSLCKLLFPDSKASLANLATSCTSCIFSVEMRYMNFCFGFIALH